MKAAAELNRAFGIEGELGFTEMDGEPVAWVRNGACAASIAVRGAQVVSWYPSGHAEVLWISDIRPKSPDQPVRGGVPICWPWFGPHPEDPAKPNHGFVRNRLWTVAGSASNTQATELTLETGTTPADRALWPHRAEVSLRVIAGATLRLELTTRNPGTDGFGLTQALHSYFHVADITDVEVEGFDGLDYLDKVEAYALKRQSGTITIGGEVDRIFLGHTGPAVIRDAALGRAIIITKSGSTSSVVWNPWDARAAQLADMGPDGYRRMLCVETANAGDDIVRLEPGGVHTLTAEFQVASG
ncbi:MAG: D-hexose-6-phosphate mutarotase [Hyphomicrobiaceae bacterium]|nr:D-hexose-6-phosphate mutarotase [Hyphomicrobiaceae bacterium]